jgi:hypothetical protein
VILLSRDWLRSVVAHGCALRPRYA